MVTRDITETYVEETPKEITKTLVYCDACLNLCEERGGEVSMHTGEADVGNFGRVFETRVQQKYGDRTVGGLSSHDLRVMAINVLEDEMDDPEGPDVLCQVCHDELVDSGDTIDTILAEPDDEDDGDDEEDDAPGYFEWWVWLLVNGETHPRPEVDIKTTTSIVLITLAALAFALAFNTLGVVLLGIYVVFAHWAEKEKL